MFGIHLKRKTFNDTLALLIVFGVPLLWVADAALLDGKVSEAAKGASILAWGSVIQHYFRKAPPPTGT